MTLHHILPLIALVLNTCLMAIALVRNPGSRLNRIFACFVSALAVWNLGVFMLRRATDPGSAWAWEIVIHAGVTALPALYYHFVLIFLESTQVRRVALITAYALSAAFWMTNVTSGSLLVAGVQETAWGWAPRPGPLYQAFLIHSYVFLVAGLIHLNRAYWRANSGFRRNRTLLILLGTAVTILGGFVDIIRFAVAPSVPAIDRLYPLGIPANMASALLFGVAIVRYRMFALSMVVKKAVVYGAVSAGVTATLIILTWALEEALGLKEITAVWIITPLGFLFALLLTPLGRPVEDWIERLMFRRPRGCHDTLVALSKRLSVMLDLEEAVAALVRGLVRGIPVTHCALLVHDPATGGYVMRREETATGEGAGVRSLPASSPLVQGLAERGGVLVTEEASLDRRLARYFEPVGTTPEAMRAALVVGLKTEQALSGILLVGEKLSGEIFDPEELELLSVLANQAAISMANARLYQEADRERRRLEVLYQLSRRLATVSEPDEVLTLIVTETKRLLQAELAALRLVEGAELVLRACTEAPMAAGLRPRLRLGESLTGAVVAANAPVRVENVLEDRRYDPAHRQAAEATGVHGFLGVPLRTGAIVTGVLYVYTRERRCFTDDEVSLLAAFADQASISLDKGHLAVERRRAEEALRQSEKLATMGQLLAGVAHELNNPLTIVVGYAGLLKARLPGDSTAEHIETAAGHCSRIVRNFLALARKRPPERRRVELNSIVTDAAELLTYPFGIDNIKVVLDLAADLPDLWADQHQLKQVVVNLLTNAHHAMRQVTVRQVTLATRYDPGRSSVILRVVDSGPGIPPELRARIFEPFFTTKPVGEGTGLGLSLCHGIIDGHGGSITVDGEPGQGAVFIIRLPVRHPAQAGNDAAGPRILTPLPRKTILIVDDDPLIGDLLAQMLALDGHQIETTASAGAALTRLGTHRFDLIMSDIRMPRLDGPGLYREVARRYPDAGLPFVFVTGDILGADTVRFLESTKSPCLYKPFAAEEVRQAIRAALCG
jgi:signal transduction histidine kinase/CheY-like chemotaxis protein